MSTTTADEKSANGVETKSDTAAVAVLSAEDAISRLYAVRALCKYVTEVPDASTRFIPWAKQRYSQTKPGHLAQVWIGAESDGMCVSLAESPLGPRLTNAARADWDAPVPDQQQ